MSVRASLIEIFSRVISVNKSDSVYTNDIDNLYPNRIDGIINNSPTASRCAELMASYIAGQGLEDELLDVIVNKAKNYRLTDIINLSSKSIAPQYGVYYLVYPTVEYLSGLDKTFKASKLDVLPYIKCRLSKEDGDENKGKVYFKDWDIKDKYGSKQKAEWFYPYNENKDVILAQMKADSPNAKTIQDLIKGYRGQVYYLNLTPQYVYANSRFDSVYNDADTEYRLSLYVNKQMRTGFLDQTIVVTQGVDEDLDQTIHDNLTELMGADNAGNLMHISTPIGSSFDLDKVLITKQIPSSFKPELLNIISSHLKKNILGVANNIPEALISVGDGSLFGTNADTYSKLKDFYSEQNYFERKEIERTLKMFGFDVKIKPITGEKKIIETPPTV